MVKRNKRLLLRTADIVAINSSNIDTREWYIKQIDKIDFISDYMEAIIIFWQREITKRGISGNVINIIPVSTNHDVFMDGFIRFVNEIRLKTWGMYHE